MSKNHSLFVALYVKTYRIIVDINMKKAEKFEKKLNSLLYNHLWLKYLVEWGIAVIATAFSAAIFSLGIVVFLQPDLLGGEAANMTTMVSGGSSGAAQVINLIFTASGISLQGNNSSLIYSVSYVLVNIPLVIIAFRGVGKRFGALTLLNVILGFVFTNVFKGQFFIDIAEFVSENAGMLGRALFAGICVGLSSAVAFKIDASAGGFDIISYYISLKKSTLAGKYSVMINSVIIGSFELISVITNHDWVGSFAGILFSSIYLLTVMLVVDVINIRNKKAQIEIITSKKELPKLLLANIPHGATLINAKGVYSDKDRYIVYMVVSTTEVKNAVKVIKQLDPESFVSVTSLQQVYGNFHMKSVK